MTTFSNVIILLFIVAVSIPFYRLIKGPTVFDRLLSIGAIGGKAIILILLIGLHFDRISMFVDIALGYAILNFIGGIAMAEYFRLRKEEG
ncbi:monovalent cation/H+ antiporter complex subunit F [Pelagicoccus sp. SDUM812002]|uniref:monovalent cation/H+ antiporter complex subunit F n=1 Tax=Pelagicoccus sp. SDUM812002 TaxID=3041266 RepID=UPI00280CE55F|nr:monovalent cation/H+ antiporter complex subunit F [Pelagicoccus sp. SDUM812002]MDQ8185485.1 monovalent cation/H+ antiporter complex subunit F [Pelagicoccus sp. SDUM812002]